MHLGGLAMGLTNIRLGDYIERSTQNNKDLEYGTDLIVGVNSQGIFAVPKGNTDGVDLKPYKIVNDGAFVYNPTRLELGSIAYRTEGLCIVSHLYMVFYLTDEGNIVKHPDKVVNVEECGPNVLKIIFTMDNIKIYMSRPSLFDIPDDVQIRFNDSDIVTGGRGYNAWWGKEYERREADDL